MWPSEQSLVGSGERDPRDFYETPDTVVRAALDLVLSRPARIIDLGAGKGRWGIAARERWPAALIVGVDLHFVNRASGYNQWTAGDALSVPLPTQDLVMMNPPFRHAEAFIRRGWDLLTDQGEMIALLRLEFLASQGRWVMWTQDMPPVSAHVLCNRPSFSGNRRTDFHEYMIAHWKKGAKATTRLEWILEGK